MSEDVFSPIRWSDGSLHLLDQRLLPHREEWIACGTAGEVAEAISSMVVRGAPAIGIAAAFGMALESSRSGGGLAALEDAARLLVAARPTAVNLRWAADRMMALARGSDEQSRTARLIEEALAILREDIEANRRIGDYGARLLQDEVKVLTHCNAGALATGGWGTALGVVRSAVAMGKRVAVFADETRPWLQGARLTTWELEADGIDVTLIADDMAGALFRSEGFDAVIVGADRIAANGDVANKIGTYTLGVLAQAHQVPFYVAAPVSTIDLKCADGDAIPIEERDPDEVRSVTGVDEEGRIRRVRIAPAVKARHLAFDVTPARLVSAIITDRGVCRAPYEVSLQRAVRGGK